MKRKSVYATMKAHDLARVTRERGLDKPNVITLSEWADFLEADDAKRLKADTKSSAKAAAGDADRDTEEADTPALKTETSTKDTPKSKEKR